MCLAQNDILWNIIVISKKLDIFCLICIFTDLHIFFAYFHFWSSVQNYSSRLKVLSWNVPTLFAVRKSTDHLLPPTFPLGPHRWGLWQPGWALGQSQTSAFWAGNWRCSTLHNLCLRVKTTFFLRPAVVVLLGHCLHLLGHCSHLNLPLRNILVLFWWAYCLAKVAQ